MIPLFQFYDFSYPDGILFYDRSGVLARRLQEGIPSLAFKVSTVDQREFTSAEESLDLLYGIAFSRIQTLGPSHDDFSSLAEFFHRSVTETLEIGQLREFHYRTVSGRQCNSQEEAGRLMSPLFPEETRTDLLSSGEPTLFWTIQTDFQIGNFSFESRIALMDLVPDGRTGPPPTIPGLASPHVTFHLDVRGLVPIDVAKFDCKAFIDNVRLKQATEILMKFAPHLAEL